eukprot:Plantae.Rhodophyta-Rhodochaete_pulchella.ctg12569.p1 GENE.Plantae.Rhodophyta-Rhodochaete_pulchella.ctg12569~~Plantae.Rhodophyta-Rhodochaete_pulchella.ctg12569.p1  ORF type:complete len:856 (-),score=98.18 Plantae.Rhodophyta-Rhodochaete_pulchella.ctg12569:27-2594(-)
MPWTVDDPVEPDSLPVLENLSLTTGGRATVLEAAGRRKIRRLGLFQAAAIAVFAVLTAVFAALRHSASASVISWLNLAVTSCTILLVLSYATVYAVSLLRDHDDGNSDRLWALVLMSSVILANNPLFNLDRLDIASFDPADRLPRFWLAAMPVLRYITNAFVMGVMLLFFSCKLASFARAEPLDAPFGFRDFYAYTLTPAILGIALMASLTTAFKVELSPQPLVGIVALLATASREPGTLLTTGLVSGFQVIVLVLFFAFARMTQASFAGKSYAQNRRKQVHHSFFFVHTFVTVAGAAIGTAICAALIDRESGVTAENGPWKETVVLDLPYSTRGGIVFVYSVYSVIQAYVVLTAANKSQSRSRVEREILHRIVGSAKLENESAPRQPSLSLNSRTDLSGKRIHEPNLLALDDVILALNIAWLCYFDEDTIEKVLQTHGYELRGMWVQDTIDVNVMVVESPSQIIVAYRGTVSLANWVTNLKFLQTEHLSPDSGWEEPEWLEKAWKPPKFGARRPMVHRGFWSAYSATRIELLREVEACSQAAPGRRVLVTGHSLGGALATLCAFDMATSLKGTPRNLISLRTFGSPRVGNRAFTRRFAAAVHDSFRIVNRYDIVTSVPANTWPISFEHVSRPVLIDSDGNWIMDPLYSDIRLFSGSRVMPHMMPSYRNSIRAFIQSCGSSVASSFASDHFWDFSALAGGEDAQLADLVNETMILKRGASLGPRLFAQISSNAEAENAERLEVARIISASQAAFPSPPGSPTDDRSDHSGRGGSLRRRLDDNSAWRTDVDKAWMRMSARLGSIGQTAPFVRSGTMPRAPEVDTGPVRRTVVGASRRFDEYQAVLARRLEDVGEEV